jgi:hypothetical protein
MEIPKETASQQKTQAAIQQLKLLKEKMYCGNVSQARRAAHNLSWMQEDGLEIFRGALLSNATGATKNAAGYGLRRMQGRMRKAAVEVLREALRYPDPMTRDISKKALQMSGAAVAVRPENEKIEGNRQ